MFKLNSVITGAVVCTFTVSTVLAVGAGESDNVHSGGFLNYDAYLAGLEVTAVNATRSVNPARISSDLTGGHAQQLDPLMNKAVFVWAGVNEPVPVVGPLEPSALIDAQAREFLRRQGPAMGLTPAILDTAELFEVQDLGRGPLIARYEQRINGLEVFNRTLNVMLDRAGRPVAASGYFATDFKLTEVLAKPFSLSPAAAIVSAFAQMGGQIGAYALSPAETRGDYQHFSVNQPVGDTLRLSRSPRAKLVYYPDQQTLEPGYYVELAATDNARGHSLMHSYVISAISGDMLFRNDQIAYEANTYRVFADGSGTKQPFDAPLGNGYVPFPGSSSGDVITRTGAGTNLVTLDYAGISTGDPWLPAGATVTTGNHVDACIDSTDTPVSGIIVNPGNTCVAELGDLRARKTGPNTFDYPITADSDPSTSNARNAAIVNLFYVINWLHDWWYDHGFNEAARNAQANNYGRGGAQADPLLAQGQDASGRNNANMGTPADGASPTMQQYLWNGPVKGEVRVLLPADSGPLKFSSASFGPSVFNIPANAVLANDGAGISPSDGCGAASPNATVPTPAAAPQATLKDNIALIDRGNCSFTDKAKFATSSGAVGMIVINNTDGEPITMGNGDVPVNAGATPSDPAYQIASVMIRKINGQTIKTQLAAGAVRMRMQRLPTVDADATLDNQIIAHEYFHYVSNRLINNSSGLGNNQGRGMGEGWGDLNAIMLSTRADDRSAPGNSQYEGAYALAWYVTNNFYTGIRRVPYSTDFAKNAFTFKHIQNGIPTPDGGPGTTNAAVHNTGEIWANMVWECYVRLLNDPRHSFDEAQSRMQDYLIAGMKMTPASPTFTEARDGILASAFATDYGDFAGCARGFAKRGAGVYAVSPPRADATNAPVTESYIALVGRFPLVKTEFIPDPNDYCDADAVLDSGESGALALTFRNDGTFVPSGPITATISTTESAVTLANGGQITLPALRMGESATVTLGVTAGTIAGSPATVPLKIAFQPVAPGDSAVEPPPDSNTSFFANHDGGLRNFDDIEDPTTSPLDWTRTGSGATWTQKAATATQGNGKVWFANNPATVSDIQLVTPEFSVPSGGNFSMQFVHFFNFENGFDGGVIEVQVDGGGWTDAIAFGASFTQGNGYNDTAINALNNRPGFSNTNNAKEAMTLDFGARLAGRKARIRFRSGSDNSTADDGWYIDDVRLNGIAAPVFNFFAPENGVCLLPVTVSAGTDFTAPEHPTSVNPAFSTVNLNGSVTDPNVPPITVTYEWGQLSGPAVSLTGANTLRPSFTAPSVSSNTLLEFQLIVSSGRLLLGTDNVAVTIANVNLTPTANAGKDLVVSEAQSVTLDGSKSKDDDGETVTYLWEQTGGALVALTDATSAAPSFTAPALDADTLLTFRLTVSDPFGAKSSDFIVVTVRDVLQPVGSTSILGGALSSLSLLVLGLIGGFSLRRNIANR